ncbi:MAG: phosphoribosylamine--glycine ligase [Deltaproteobacteria bacterium GWA2_54_12]|nr:MAG: phosphoribosylamine--glycine ligase [Deltaproteobacteria bacterium GWA2_54_12]
MKVLIVGGGGREHALAWKLSQSSRVTKLFIAPGNPGTAMHGENVPIAAEEIEELKAFALREKIDFTVVGPELPLTLGITDSFSDAGLLVFGPSKAAAELEGSKAFSKELMLRHNIPTAFYKKFEDAAEAKAYIETHNQPLVVKADGLAAGKGVVICQSAQEAIEAVDLIMTEKAFGSAGKKIIIEEFLVGEEASFLAITDGRTVLPLAPAQDHKAIFDGDRGPNTGGMGAYSPAPVLTPELQKKIMERVMLPAVRGMEKEGRPYKGILYAGLMMTKTGPKVLEFNCRFGDPETQPILMRLGSDLLEALLAAAKGNLDEVSLEWKKEAAVCVVMAAKGYPGEYLKGSEIKGLDMAALLPDTVVFHAGTTRRDGKVVTSGGRVLGVTALGADIKTAIENAYKAVALIDWEGAQYRTDIGKKALR